MRTALTLLAFMAVCLAGPRAYAQEPASTAEETTASTEQVNIATATAEELMRLPGIGPAKADAILEQRERAPFRRIEDILRVPGIGRATFRRLRPFLTVTGATTLQRDVPMRRP